MQFEKKYFFILTHSNYTHTQYNLTEINTHIGTQAAYEGMLFQFLTKYVQKVRF